MCSTFPVPHFLRETLAKENLPMTNITLTVDDALAKEAKILAAQRGTSVVGAMTASVTVAWSWSIPSRPGRASQWL